MLPSSDVRLSIVPLPFAFAIIIYFYLVNTTISFMANQTVSTTVPFKLEGRPWNDVTSIWSTRRR